MATGLFVGMLFRLRSQIGFLPGMKPGKQTAGQGFRKRNHAEPKSVKAG
jgi:hypothetical protein